MRKKKESPSESRGSEQARAGNPSFVTPRPSSFIILPTCHRSSSPPLGRHSSSPAVMAVGGCLPVVVICHLPIVVVQRPPLALFIGSLWSSLFLPVLLMFVLPLLSFVPPSLLGAISIPHPPCEQWLAAADVGARVILLWWCWGHPLVVLGFWHCPFIIVIIAASSHLLPVLKWLGS
jgi:hypothetical protein